VSESDRCTEHRKVRYVSAGAARAAIRTIRRRSSRTKVPVRAYYDSGCRSWHITSHHGRPS
jgi:hypothetical protein